MWCARPVSPFQAMRVKIRVPAQTFGRNRRMVLGYIARFSHAEPQFVCPGGKRGSFTVARPTATADPHDDHRIPVKNTPQLVCTRYIADGRTTGRSRK